MSGAGPHRAAALFVTPKQKSPAASSLPGSTPTRWGRRAERQNSFQSSSSPAVAPTIAGETVLPEASAWSETAGSDRTGDW
ncbi:hypothetical protein GCM10022280_04410 [Sphingomonas swuensis]|uniref:Uncharacterized protein n=1 Tax=Sphingomonas swuensis TaxID=977800 RepID=A0ABP7SDL3_9SPHN